MPSSIRLQLPASVRVAVLMCALPLPGALAHHAFVAVYDPRETATIEGEFAGLELVNPHAWVYIDVTTENGRIERWTVEAAGKLSLARRGWTDDMFQQGEVITAVGHPALSGDTAMWMVKIVKSDGREYFAPNVEDANAIEAERSERARRAREQAREQQ